MSTKVKCRDHLGNEYDSIKAMCDAYGISLTTYYSRKQKGYGIEKCLSSIKMNRHFVDHKNIVYSSFSAMCAAYGLDGGLVRGRIKAGWTLEEALEYNRHTYNRPKYKYTDHKGNKYESLEKMCLAYGKESQLVKDRMSRGWTLEEALESPIGTYRKKKKK